MSRIDTEVDNAVSPNRDERLWMWYEDLSH